MIFTKKGSRAITYVGILVLCVCFYFEQSHLSSNRTQRHQDEELSSKYKNLYRKLGTRVLEVCQDLRVGRLMAPQPNEWQTLVPRESYVYSAYADPRAGNETVIRIFGIMLRALDVNKAAGEFWCQLWLEGGADVPVILKSDYSIQGHAREKYVSVEWTCTLAAKPSKLPNASVSLVVNSSCSQARNLVSVHRLQPTGNFKREFTVCLAGVVKNEYSNYHQLVEWAEVNRMFGAEYFVLYKENASDIIAPYVRHYADLGLMETIPWKLPDLGDVKDFDVIWNLGQVTAINDCIFRNMYVSKYVVSVDFDELIVPYGNSDSWSAMMVEAGCEERAVYLLRNAFFGIGENWSQTGTYKKDKTVADVLHLRTLTMTKQDAYVNFFPKRSKFIARADVVRMAGIHNVKGIWGVKNRNPLVCEIRLPYGRLHHYRDPRWEDIEPTDNTYMYKYAEEIITRTKNIHQKVLGLQL